MQLPTFRLLTLLVLCTSATLLCGQVTSISFEAGLRYDFVTVDQKTTDYDIPDFGWAVSNYGILISRTFNDNWEIESGLRFSEYSIHREKSGMSPTKVNLTTALQLPLNFGYRVQLSSLGSGSLNLVPSLGYSLNYLITDHRGCFCGVGKGVYAPFIGSYNAAGKLFHLAQVGAKLEYDFSNNWGTYIGVQQHMGFSEIATVYWVHANADHSGTDLGHTNGSYLALSAGVKLNL